MPPHHGWQNSGTRGRALVTASRGLAGRSPCPCALLSSRTASSPEPPGSPSDTLAREILAGSPGTLIPRWAGSSRNAQPGLLSTLSAGRQHQAQLSALESPLLNDHCPSGQQGLQGEEASASSSGKARHAHQQQARGIARAGRRDVRGGQDARPGRHGDGPSGSQRPLACRPALQGQPPATASVGAAKASGGSWPGLWLWEPWGPGPLGLSSRDQEARRSSELSGSRHVVDWAALCRPHLEIAHGWIAGRRIDAFELWLEDS